MAKIIKASLGLRMRIDEAVAFEDGPLSSELVAGLKAEGLLDEIIFGSHTPLTFACKAGVEESVRVLLAAGADPKASNQLGQCPLMWACDSDAKLPIAIALMDAGADVEQANQVSDRPLHTAVQGGDMGLIRELISRGADIEAPGLNGWRPIHMACKTGKLELVKLLAERGVDLERRVADHNKKKTTPMGIAAAWLQRDPQSYLECIAHIATVLAARDEAKMLASVTKPRGRKAAEAKQKARRELPEESSLAEESKPRARRVRI